MFAGRKPNLSGFISVAFQFPILYNAVQLDTRTTLDQTVTPQRNKVCARTCPTAAANRSCDDQVHMSCAQLLNAACSCGGCLRCKDYEDLHKQNEDLAMLKKTGEAAVEDLTKKVHSNAAHVSAMKYAEASRRDQCVGEDCSISCNSPLYDKYHCGVQTFTTTNKGCNCAGCNSCPECINIEGNWTLTDDGTVVKFVQESCEKITGFVGGKETYRPTIFSGANVMLWTLNTNEHQGHCDINAAATEITCVHGPTLQRVPCTYATNGKVVDANKCCVFPFTYGGTTHESCAGTHNDVGHGWCSLVQNLPQKDIEGMWGGCASNATNPRASLET